mmetsp:Transcript_17903/g.29376  ORF Transcript_17903/g.29376 Transcript_17903/m.29376 type:complete len:81 (+) Transcript_17903:60-302(+)
MLRQNVPKKVKTGISYCPKKQQATSGVVTSALSCIQIQSPNFWYVKCVGQRENVPNTVFDTLQCIYCGRAEYVAITVYRT